MFKLVISDDEGKQTVVPVVRDEITIGRQEGNTIRLTERNVSRRHGKLLKVNGSLYFEEVSARYGTAVNGDKVRGRTEVKLGDVLTIGDYNLFLQNPDGTMPEAVRRLLEGEPDVAPAPEQRDATEVLTMQPRPAPTSTEPAKICGLNGDYAGQTFTLMNQMMVVGRTTDNDIVVDHKSISRHHARIERAEGGIYRVTDLGSANGITINGEPRPTFDLRRGDVFELGNVKFRFIAPGEMWTYTPGAAAGAGPAATITAAPAEQGGGMGKLIAIFVVVLLLVGGGVAVVMSSGGDTTGGDGDTNATDNNTGGAATETPSQADTGGQQAMAEHNEENELALQQAGVLMEDGRWEDAVSVLDAIPNAAPQFSQADQMKVRARAEMRNEDAFNRATQSEQSGNLQEALNTLASIPDDSHYHDQAVEGHQRIQDAMVEQASSAAQSSIRSNDFDEARSQVQPVVQLFPDDARLASLMGDIDSAEQDYERRQQEQAARERERQTTHETTHETPHETPHETTHETTHETPTETPTSPAETHRAASDLIRDARREGIRGNHEEAIRLLEEAKDMSPNESRIYLMLYTNYSRVGNNRQAARALREYLRLEPNDANAAEYREIIDRLEGN